MVEHGANAPAGGGGDGNDTTGPCCSERCPLQGRQEYMGYCYPCAKRLGIAADAAPAAPGSAPPPVVTATPADPPAAAPASAVPAGSATGTVVSAIPTTPCATEGCTGEGLEATLGYCVPCARRLGIPVPAAATAPPPASPADGALITAQPSTPPFPVTTGAATNSSNTNAQGDCRGGCGFFASPQYCGLCSSCWRKLGDDMYLKAIVGIAVDRTDHVQRFLDAGGTILRKTTDAEVNSLRAVGFYVSPNKTMTELADELGMINALSFLLQRDTSLTVVSDLDRRSTVSMLLAENDADKPSDAHAPRHVDDEGAVVFATENVRLEVISTQDVRGDNLVSFWTAWDPDDERSTHAVVANAGRMDAATIGKGFALPASVRAVSAQDRTTILRRFMEQQDMLEDVTRATGFFPTVPRCEEVVPLYTVADLNCLMHGAFTAMAAVRDGILCSDDPDASTATTRTVLRNGVRNSIKHCVLLQRVIAPASSTPAAATTPAAAATPTAATHDAAADLTTAAADTEALAAPTTDVAQCGGSDDVNDAPAAAAAGAAEASVETPPAEGVDAARLQQLQHDIDQGKASLDGGHVFALANVLRRPVVVYAHVGLEGEFRKELTVPFRISGIYLPLLWPPEKTCPDPLLLCYTPGHFSAVVPIAASEQGGEHFDHAVPLCDEEFVPLPVHFLPEAAAADVEHVRRLAGCEMGSSMDASATARSPITRRPMGPRHRQAEMAILRAYLRNVTAVPLIEDDSEPTAADNDDDDESEDAVPRITLCQQRHRILDGAAADGDVSETERYLVQLTAALDGLVAQHVAKNAPPASTTAPAQEPVSSAPEASPSTEPPASALRSEGQDAAAGSATADNTEATAAPPDTATAATDEVPDAVL